MKQRDANRALLAMMLFAAAYLLVAEPPFSLTSDSEVFSARGARNEAEKETFAPPNGNNGTSARASVLPRPEASSLEALPDQLRSWREEYFVAEDRFAFAVRAAEAAMEGDRRAQYFLSRALRDCYIQVGPIGASGLEIDVYLERLFSGLYSLPGQIPNERRQIERCERFLSAETLTRFSIPPDPQEHSYWLGEAATNGDALAMMEQATLAAIALTGDIDGEEAQSIKSQALLAVRAAVTSKEPAAIAAVGALYWSADLAEDHSFQGPAWLTAACELGFDCTADNPDFMLLNCDYQTVCPTLQDILIRDFGAEYARIYAASQDIIYKLQTDDWDGLQQYLDMK